MFRSPPATEPAAARRVRGATTIASILTATTLALSGCTASPAPAEDLTLVIGSQAECDGWNMVTCGDFGAMMDISVDPLWRSTPDPLVFTPALAREFSWNDDGTILSLVLEEGVTYSDDSPFDAETLRATLEAYRSEEYFQSIWLAPITEVEVTGEYTLDLHVERFDRDLMFELSFISIISPESAAAGPTADALIGTGAYVIDQEASSVGAEYVFVKREEAWEADKYDFDRIVAKVLPDPIARLNALKSGQIDYAPLTPEFFSEVEASGLGVLVTNEQWVGLQFVDFAGAVNPAIADPRVRQAINYAFDRESIVESMYPGTGIARTQAFPPTSGYYLEDREDEYPYDPDRARDLLTEAGYPDGFDFTIGHYLGFTPYGPYIQQALEDIGIRATFVDLLTAADPTAIGAVIQETAGAETLSLHLAPDAAWNLTKHTDPRLDEQLAILADPGAGAEELAEAQAAIGELVLEDAWLATLMSAPRLFVFSSDYAFDDRAATEPSFNKPPLWYLHPAD